MLTNEDSSLVNKVRSKMAILEAKNLIIFAKIFIIFSRFWMIENSEFSKHYEKMMLKSNFENCQKLVPTQTFEFKFGMQGPNEESYF